MCGIPFAPCQSKYQKYLVDRNKTRNKIHREIISGAEVRKDDDWEQGKNSKIGRNVQSWKIGLRMLLGRLHVRKEERTGEERGGLERERRGEGKNIEKRYIERKRVRKRRRGDQK